MSTRPVLIGWLVSRASALRFPRLFALTALLFALDFVMPDPIPLLDELMLGLTTALLASWRRRKTASPGNAT